MRKLLIGAVFLLLFAAWWSTVNTVMEKPVLYNKHINKAKKYEEQEIYYDAILEYRNALEYSPDNMEIYLKIAEDYKKLGDKENFLLMCNTAINSQEDNETAIFYLADYYIEEGEEKEAIALLRNQINNKKESSALEAKLQTLAGGYSFFSKEYDYISETVNGYMMVQVDEKKGLISDNGQEVIYPQYEEIGFFGENGFAPVKKDGEWFFIDINNYKRRVPEKKYNYLGIVSQKIIPAQRDGMWGYLNENMEEITGFDYEQVTPMMDGIAAMKKNGKWALVGEDLKQITDYEFDDIVLDECGFCSRNGVVFVKSGNRYLMIDKKGLQVGQEEFEAVKPFISQNSAAVQQNGKWGFISKDGELLLKCVYEDAKSFSDLGYAAVQKEGMWGYIKTNGDFVIEPEFENAKGFNSQGIAPVYVDNIWKLIQLDIY